MTESFSIDEIDLKILSLLKENSRIKISEIAKRLGIPVSTVYTRIKKLEQQGIIRKYTIDLDYKKLGFKVTAIILIKYDSSSKVSQRELLKEIMKFNNVEKGYIITGEWDLLIIAKFKDIEELSRFILEKLRNIEGVKETYTSIVLD